MLGIDPEPTTIEVRGVNEPMEWAATVRRVAARLVPSVPVDVEVGQEHGLDVIVVHVPFVLVPHGFDRPADGAPTRLVDGRPVAQFRPLKVTASWLASPQFATVTGSTPAWLDPAATCSFASHAPAA